MRGLFSGLTTLDVIQLVDSLPAADQKVRAKNFTISAGGPATNAAVAFAQGYPFGNESLQQEDEAVLISRISSDGVGALIRDDLVDMGVKIEGPPVDSSFESTVASILVTELTGERAVVSMGDQYQRRTLTPAPDDFVKNVDVSSFDIFETDGYETDVTLPLLKKCKQENVLTILDGGSVKNYTPALLPFIDVAIVSEAFAEERSTEEVFVFLKEFGVRYMAITRGGGDIEYSADGVVGRVTPPEVHPLDTLGAGDFFHGSFVKALAQKEISVENFVEALTFGSEVAAFSIKSFGTREWISQLRNR